MATFFKCFNLYGEDTKNRKQLYDLVINFTVKFPLLPIVC
jgi:hypothetical protein